MNEAERGKIAGVLLAGGLSRRMGGGDKTLRLLGGRPVLAQDTGFSEWLPCGRGVIAFRSPDEVVSAVSEVEGHYDLHCRTARELAEEYFSASHVLSSLIDTAMTSSAEDR